MSFSKNRTVSEYPLIKIKRDIYNELYGLKYELKEYSFNEVLEILIDEHKRLKNE